ncbi:pyocin knob domain-containing protein [Rahnella aceris]|uniref:pyocin knob domain-containing protein n=1 Tax=Rahnella sp. (strain Y9602) TaxID=2703885 RepID=UPI001F2A1F6C|nr:pyocin knob domain-containing protein [Rahnella aceris]
MTLGFGNNVVSTLASEITASQKTIPVMPGTGAKFAELLTQDNVNSSTALNMFAKITLTDAGETEFEICHLLSVSGDVLTVVRGQEKTEAKGWMLNDVVANFATRGSENQFVQVEHLQSGFYCAGVVGGSANALTLNLPASFFLNGSTDWILRTPVILYPTQNNTGAATLQLTMGGKVLGTFPLYKGDKKQLAAKDILKDVPLVCLLDNSKTFFNVTNPGAIYAGLGTAAFADLTTSPMDTTVGHVIKVRDYGIGYTGLPSGVGVDFATEVWVSKTTRTIDYTLSTNVPEGWPKQSGTISTYVRHVSASSEPDKQAVILDLYPYGTPGMNGAPAFIAYKTSNQWAFAQVMNTFNKPAYGSFGVFPAYDAVLSVDLNTLGAHTDAGVHYQTTNASATTANHYPIAEAGSLLVTPTAYGCMQEYTAFGSGRKFVRGLSATWNGTNGPWHDWVEYLKQKDTAAAATKLATAHKIAGHPFDGTADISISGSDVGLDKVGNFAAVQQGGGAGMGTNKVYIGWTGSKVKIQVDASDMGEVYTTVNPPPVTSVVTDSRQGALQDIGHLGDGQNIAPAGCSLIGLAHNGSSDTKNMGLYCAANQICINGNWRTIERL